MTTNDELSGHRIQLALGQGNGLGKVKNVTWSYKKLKRRLSEPLVDTSVSFAQYLALDQDAKLVKKRAAGNFVAAWFEDGRRKLDKQQFRSMIALDLDYVTVEQLEYIREGLAEINLFAWIMHTTRAHCPEKPRVRIFVLLKRNLDATEANAITRLLSLYLADDPTEAIEIPDLVSFRYNQTMFLPSHSRGQEYWVEDNEADILDPDEFLAQHPGWEDYTQLPYQEAEKSRGAVDPNLKMEDPREKHGKIGAFCRAYSVEDVIDKWLTDVYAPGDSSNENRYSYLLGTGSNGAVVYDDGLFIHSNHGSDPIEGSANAWDLLRIHKFGHLDDKARDNTSAANMPSFLAMERLAETDELVLGELAAGFQFDMDGLDDFGDDEPPAPKPKPKPKPDDLDDLLGDGSDLDDLLGDGSDDDDEPESDDPMDMLDDQPEEDEPKKAKPWQTKLKLDKQGEIEKCKHNAILIVTHDKRIAPTIARNEMTGGPYVRYPLRFPEVGPKQAKIEDKEIGRKWTDNDTAGLAWCLSAPKTLKGYSVDFSNLDLQQGMLQAAEQNRFNPVIDMIEKVVWDGVKRAGMIFIDYLGAEDNAYHRELGLITLLAAVVRLYEPGHDWQIVPIIGGKQGGGKSGFIRVLGGSFYGELSSDFSNTQKMVESTNGKWILEVPELSGFRKSEVEDVKQYFSARFDTVRLAYRTNQEDFPRLCIYIGTTNQDAYLRDNENRRFCPVLTSTDRDNLVDFAKLEAELPQIWAEIIHTYRQMRKEKPSGFLHLNFSSKEAREEALRLQTEAREAQPHEAVAEVLVEYLDQEIAESDLAGNQETMLDDLDDEPKFVRNLATVTELRQALSDNPIVRDVRMSQEKVFGLALASLGTWESLGSVRRCGRRARWWQRVGTDGKAVFGPAPAEEDDLGDVLG